MLKLSRAPAGPPSSQALLHFALWAVAALLLWQMRGVLLLGFTSILIALALRAMADPLARRTHMPRQLSLALVVLLTLGFLVGALALFGWRIADQYDDILAKVQISLQEGTALANSHAVGRYLLHVLRGARIDGATAMLTPLVSSAIGSFGQGVAYAAIVIASGVFLAIDPDRYVRGVLFVVPPARRSRVESFLDRTGSILRKWLVSRLIVMVAIGVLSSLGLWLLKVDGAFALGLTGGLLTFIPLVGALIAAVPAILVAFAQSPQLALYVGLMYWAVHFIEGTFITPYVQDEEVDLPPVVTMYSAVAFTVFFGAWGIFLSSPLALVAIVAVNMLVVDGSEPELASTQHPPRAPALKLASEGPDAADPNRPGTRRDNSPG
jgi:predicted PurR-regulated permease PerM